MLTRKMIVGMVLAVLVLVGGSALGDPNQWYVDPDGNDACDCSSWDNACATIGRALEMCSDYCDVIDVNTGTYLTGPILIDDSNIEISFQEGVLVAAKSNNDPCDPNLFTEWGDHLFRAVDKENITLKGVGAGATLRMNKEEYGGVANGRSVIWLYNCNNVEISRLSLEDGGGDGILLEGRNNKAEYCKDILISSVTCDNNFRNAISVVSVDGLTIEDCVLKGTSGAPLGPCAGIDFEPNTNLQRLKNIKVRKTAFQDNAWKGIQMYLDRLQPEKVTYGGFTLSSCWTAKEFWDIDQANGMAVFTASGDIDESEPNRILEQNIWMGGDKYYTVVVDVDEFDYTGSGQGSLGIYLGDQICGVVTDADTFPGTFTYEKVHVSENDVNDGHVKLVGECDSATSFSIKVDSISVKEVDSNGDVVAVESMDIDIDDVYITGGKNGIVVSQINDDAPADSSISFNNVTIANTSDATYITAKSYEKVDVSFEKCVWTNTATGPPQNPPIHIIGGDNHIDYVSGGIDFNDCQVFDDINRPAIDYFKWKAPAYLYDISVDLYVKNDERSGSLYNWGGATLNNVDTNNLLAGLDSNYIAYNSTEYKWYTSIQSAIDNATDGDIIKLTPLRHYETIDFDGNTVTLESFDPNDLDVIAATIIDADGGARALDMDTASTISGLTIRGGTYGVYCDSASPVIEKCIIEDNTTTGVYCSGGGPEIINNKICDNGSYGIYSDGSSAEIKNNWIYRNGDEGIHFAGAASPAPVVRNNTIAYNTNHGVLRALGNVTSPTISNCILWGNSDDLDRCSATYSCIEDGDNGTGNIDDDPMFVDDVNDDYHLGGYSPCIDTGDSGGDYSGEVDIDLDGRVMGAEVDMGGDEYDSPVSYWKLDESSGTTAADSVGDNDGNVYNATWTTGQIDGALDFDGSGDYVEVAHNDNLNLVSEGTVSAWVNLNSSYRQAIATKLPSTSSGNYFLFTTSGSHMCFGISNGNWSELVLVTTSGDAITNEWAFYVGTFDSNSVNLYENGVLVDSLPNTITPVTTTAPLYIGRWEPDTNWDCSGKIDDVRVYNRALSDEEVEELYDDGSGG